MTYRLSLLLDKICYFNVDEEIEMMDDKYIQYFDDEWKLNSLQLEKIEGIFEEGILLTKRDAYIATILTKYRWKFVDPIYSLYPLCLKKVYFLA